MLVSLLQNKATVPFIKQLILTNCPEVVGDITTFGFCSNLEMLNLKGTGITITPEDLADVKEVLPNCKMQISGSKPFDGNGADRRASTAFTPSV